jgi:hypothetical protein
LRARTTRGEEKREASLDALAGVSHLGRGVEVVVSRRCFEKVLTEPACEALDRGLARARRGAVQAREHNAASSEEDDDAR